MRKTSTFLLIAALLTCAAVVSASAGVLEVFQINLENVVDARLGSTVDVSIQYVSGSEIFNSFDFLVSFDADNLTLIDALPGNAIQVCGWEDFHFEQVPCPGCEKQLYRIWATADLDNGAQHPSCLSTYGELARLRIKMPVSPSFAGEMFNVDFYWQECGDNTLMNVAQDTTYYGKFVFDHSGSERTGIDPNLGGTPPDCIAPDDIVPIRAINYFSGSVTLSTELGLFGDVNGDGRVNISDATYLIAYIFYAGPPPQDYLSGDLNMDGNTDIADALFLLDYIFGLVTPG